MVSASWLGFAIEKDSEKYKKKYLCQCSSIFKKILFQPKNNNFIVQILFFTIKETNFFRVAYFRFDMNKSVIE